MKIRRFETNPIIRPEMDERRRLSAQLRSLAIYHDLVILATIDAHIVGLDARTGAVGPLVWLAWWGSTRPVHVAVTGLLPLPIAAICGLAPMDQVATSYAQDTILLLLGANILTSGWARWRAKP